MADVLAPRGPDGAGLIARGPLAFAHRRLKIIDLSEAAAQPMIDPELGLGLVYNGALYNYRELRCELECLGYRFFSGGDTEVLLKAHHAWGDAFVRKLNGMFAFALWHRDSGRVLLGRDRLGIKPLYYAPVPGGMRVASTLPALLAAGEVDTGIDPVALHHYLSFHSVVPAPRTLLAGVRKLPPGTLLAIAADGTVRQERYWALDVGAPEGGAARSFPQWQAEVLEALRTSVRRRLVADVPVGVLLSGGLDSSLIVGLLAEQGQTVETFSIGFEGAGGERGDEFEYSDLIAAHFGTRHHRIWATSAEVLPALERAVGAMSEPMVSHDNVGFFLLSQEVARHVKVVQSGQGADEVFGGYHWYPPLLDAAAGPETYARVFCDRDHAEMARLLHPRLLGEDYSRMFVHEQLGRPGARRVVDEALRLDTTVMLVEDPVKRVDNMTMAFGLEARVPFLDHELVELAAKVPAELKVGGGGKHVLKEAARAVVPGAVIDRPKGYFPVPALKYLSGPYLERVRELLSSRQARERALFQRAEVELFLAEPARHITPLRGSKLWQIGLLEHWLQAHGL